MVQNRKVLLFFILIMLTFSPAPVSISGTDSFSRTSYNSINIAFFDSGNVLAGIDVVQCSFFLHGLPGGDGGHIGVRGGE